MEKSPIGTSSRSSSHWQYRSFIAAALIIAVMFSGCVSSELQPITAEAPVPALQRELRRAESSKRDSQQQLADYLRIVEITSQRLKRNQQMSDQQDLLIATYNRAAADFVASWSNQNRPQEIRDNRTGGRTRIFLSTSSDTAWPLNCFISLQNARRVDRRRFWRSTDRSGLGGTLIGIHPTVTAGEAPIGWSLPKGFGLP